MSCARHAWKREGNVSTCTACGTTRKWRTPLEFDDEGTLKEHVHFPEWCALCVEHGIAEAVRYDYAAPAEGLREAIEAAISALNGPGVRDSAEHAHAILRAALAAPAEGLDLAALLREAWDGWDGENGQPDDPHEWQAVCLRAAGVALAALDTVFVGPHNGCTYERAHVHPEDSPEEAHYLAPPPAEGLEEAALEIVNDPGLSDFERVNKLLTAISQPAAPAEGLDVERLARAIRTAEVRSQMGAQRMGAVPPDDGPLPDWYRAYAEDVAREYAALKRRPTDD